MIRNKVIPLIATFVFALGTAMALPASAQASSSFGVYIGGGHGGVYYGHGHPKRHYYGGSHRRHGARHAHRGHGFCGPQKALNKAWRMGLNRPHISRVKPRAIAVTGYRYGYPAKVVFHRGTPNCAVLRVRGF